MGILAGILTVTAYAAVGSRKFHPAPWHARGMTALYICPVGGLIFGVFAFFMLRDARRYQKSCDSVAATVISYETQWCGGQYARHAPIFEFYSGGKLFRVCSGRYRFGKPYRIGETVRIRSRRSYPEEICVHSHSIWLPGIGVAALAMLFFATPLFFFLF